MNVMEGLGLRRLSVMIEGLWRRNSFWVEVMSEMKRRIGLGTGSIGGMRVY